MGAALSLVDSAPCGGSMAPVLVGWAFVFHARTDSAGAAACLLGNIFPGVRKNVNFGRDGDLF